MQKNLQNAFAIAILSKMEIRGIEAIDAPKFVTISPKLIVVPFTFVLNGGSLKGGMPFVISPLDLKGNQSS